MELTRREMLRAFLGASLAAAACRTNGSRIALPPGEIVGASDRVGHRLRDGWSPRASEGARRMTQVVIVGGGVAGLAAAWRLRKRGIEDFVVLELEPVAGGTARNGRNETTRFPWGAHYIPAPGIDNPLLVELLGEMNLVTGRDAGGAAIVDDDALCRDPQERIFYRGTWYEGLYLAAGASREDLRQLAQFRKIVNDWVAWRDAKGRRAFTIPVASSSDDAELTALDRISMARYLSERGLDSPRLRWYVDYACRDDYGLRLEDTSAWAGLLYFASRVPNRDAESEPLLTWPEGNGRFVDHFLRRIGPRIETNRLVTNIEWAKDWTAVTAAHGDGSDVVEYRAQHVIAAVPQFIATRLVHSLSDERRAHARQFDYGAWLVANVSVRDRPHEPTFPLAWDNVLYESPSLGYVVATHQQELDRGPSVLTYYHALTDREPSHARDRLLQLGRDQWADVALADLEHAHPEIRSLATRVDVMRWGHAMIRPKPGFIWSEARQEAAKPFGPIHFAHSDLSGVALFEEAFHHGVRAADEVVAALHPA